MSFSTIGSLRLLAVGVLATASTLSVRAQTPAEELQRFQERYPTENVIVTDEVREVFINLSKENELQAETKYSLERMVLKEMPVRLIAGAFYSSSLTEVTEYAAFAQVPNGKKYRKQPVEQFTRSDAIEANIFYNDLERIDFEFKGIEPGAKVNYSFTTAYHQPRFLGSHHFSAYAPTENSVLRIHTDPRIEIAWDLFGKQTDLIKYTKTEGKKETIHEWRAEQVPGFRTGSGSPDRDYFAPHIVFRIANVEGAEEPSYLKTPGDLHRWYQTLIADREIEDASFIQPLVDSICTGATTEFEKVKRIYYWVQDNVSYVAFEDGMGGWIPREAELVYQRRYGDCKDMSCLIHTMLRAANIDGRFTWIGTRDIPYTYNQVPTPASDNHMICTYQAEDGTNYFLDATGRQLDIRYPSAFIMGKEALVHLGQDKYEIVTVNTPDRFQSTYTDTFHIKLDPKTGDIEGSGSNRTSGYYRMDFRYGMQVLNEKEFEDYTQILYQKGNNKCKVTLDTILNADDREKPIQVDYNYTVAAYARINNQEVYLNPHVLRSFTEHEINRNESYHYIENQFKSTQRFRGIVHIPDGYELTYVPENVSVEEDDFGFSLSYERHGSELWVNLEFYEDYLLLPEERFDAYNDMIRALKRAYKEILIFTQT